MTDPRGIDTPSGYQQQDIDWEGFFSGQTAVKDVGPFFRDSGLAEAVKKTGYPFGMTPSYEFDWEAFKDWLWKYHFEWSMGLLFMGATYTVRQHPELLPQLADSIANLVKGIGEVIPG